MKSTITLYGISNCDTIKKAKAWLAAAQIDFEFYDYRKQGLDAARLTSLVAALGWDAMLNRRGTSWRQLPDSVKENIDQAAAIDAMLANPALIKRPILAKDGQLHLGFNANQYQEIFR